MAYVVLARKYRPQRFADLVGQEHVTRTLGNAIAHNRVHHAYLFCGARGLGKTTAARLLAKCLVCVKGPTIDPCNVCNECTAVTDCIRCVFDQLDHQRSGGGRIEVDHFFGADGDDAIRCHMAVADAVGGELGDCRLYIVHPPGHMIDARAAGGHAQQQLPELLRTGFNKLELQAAYPEKCEARQGALPRRRVIADLLCRQAIHPRRVSHSLIEGWHHESDMGHGNNAIFE